MKANKDAHRVLTTTIHNTFVQCSLYTALQKAVISFGAVDTTGEHGYPMGTPKLVVEQLTNLDVGPFNCFPVHCQRTKLALRLPLDLVNTHERGNGKHASLDDRSYHRNTTSFNRGASVSATFPRDAIQGVFDVTTLKH